MTVKPYPRSGRRTIIDLGQVLADIDQDVVICVPKSVIHIARKLLLPRAGWNTSYASSYSDAGYEPATAEDIDKIEEIIAKFMEATTMDCTDFLAEIAAIGDAIEALSGFGGGCGCGKTGTSSDEAESSEDTGDIEDTGLPVPPGFDDRAEYQLYKCAAAEWLINNHLTDVQWLQTQDLGSISNLGLISGLISPIPGAGLSIALAILVAINTLGGNLLQYLEDAITNNLDDLICALYYGTNAGGSFSSWQTVLSDGIDAETSNVVTRAYLKQFAGYMITWGQLNKLFVKDDVLAGQFGESSDCACGCENTMLVGSGNFGTLSMSSAPNSSWHEIRWYFGIPQEIRLASLTGHTPRSPPPATRDWRIDSDQRDDSCGDEGNDWDEYDSNTVPSIGTEFTVARAGLRSSTPYSMTWEYV